MSALFYLKQLHKEAMEIVEAMEDPLEREVTRIQINQVYYSGRRKAMKMIRRYMDEEL